MTTPPYLRKGDKIALVAPARRTAPAEVERAISIFQAWGLEVIPGEHLFSSYNQFAGTDDQRLADLQRMLDDSSIRAIVCSRGGYGTVRIIDRLDFTGFLRSPKWIVGYSDITVLHSHIHRHYGVETLHAAMPVNFKDKSDGSPTLESIKAALFGKELSYHFPAEHSSRRGSCKGQLTGGNLSILYSLNNTASDIDTDGKILFLEDLDEYLYHIDRMMMNLRRSGKLRGLAGLVIGGMTKMHDNEVPFDKTASEIIAEAVADYTFPVCYNFPAGHLDDNLALIMGREVRFEVGEEVSLIF